MRGSRSRLAGNCAMLWAPSMTICTQVVAVALTATCLGLAPFLASGCSLRYDPDDLGGDGDGPDGGSGVEPDADPAALDFEVVPDRVFEGSGGALAEGDIDLVRAIPVVLRGQNMSSDMAVTLNGGGFANSLIEEDELAVSSDGKWAALSLHMPIRPDLTQGMFETISVRVENAAGDRTRRLIVSGLDTFAPVGGVFDTSEEPLAARYSHAVLSGNIAARGSEPFRLVAMAGITVSGSLAADAAGAAPGAGGCAGGEIASPSPCGPGSGGAGGTLSGGGGGGFGAAGSEGNGGDPGAGGQLAGDGSLVPLPPTANSLVRGAGGGGGGQLLSLAGGQPGGGGGGVIELSTPGVLRLTDSAVVSANGSAGRNSGVCATGGGSGGAGSGGAILLRTGASLATGAGAQVRALGGPAVGPNSCFGGAGGAGRIRVDSPEVPEMTTEPAAQRRAIFARDVPVVTRDQVLSLPVHGAPATAYNFYLENPPRAVSNAMTDETGAGAGDVSLIPGLNHICVSDRPPSEVNSFDEASNCVDVAYVP